MTASLFILLPVSLLFVIALGVAFWWAIFAGQFDNTHVAGASILHDDDMPETTATKSVAPSSGELDVPAVDVPARSVQVSQPETD